MKIEFGADYFEFRSTLPRGIQNEFFQFINHEYNISKALFLIKQTKIETGNINVADWAKAHCLDGEYNENVIRIFNGVMDKEAMEEKINPDYPIIIAEHEFGKGKKKEISTLIIDGNKRLRKAYLNKIENMKAYYLPVKLSKLVKE